MDEYWMGEAARVSAQLEHANARVAELETQIENHRSLLQFVWMAMAPIERARSYKRFHPGTQFAFLVAFDAVAFMLVNKRLPNGFSLKDPYGDEYGFSDPAPVPPPSVNALARAVSAVKGWFHG